jgi:hypothetical protein
MSAERRIDARSPTHERSNRKPAELAIRIVLGLAFGYLVLAAVSLVISLVQKLGTEQYAVQLPGSFDDSSIQLPQAGSAVIDSASRSTDVVLTIHNASGWLATLFVALAVLEFVIQACIAGSLVVLCLKALDRRPFTRFLPGMLYIVAGVLAVAGSAAELLQIAINAQARHEITGGSSDTILGTEYSYSFTGIWLVVGLAVAVFAVIFQLGTRMQRDTEGLV